MYYKLAPIRISVILNYFSLWVLCTCLRMCALYVCVVYMCLYVVCVWVPEKVNFEYLPPSLNTLVLEAGSFAEPGGSLIWLMCEFQGSLQPQPWNYQLCASVHGFCLSCFTLVLEIQMEVLGLAHSSLYPLSHLPKCVCVCVLSSGWVHKDACTYLCT